MTAERSAGKCPICTAPWQDAFRPFCSRRCADVDLSRWLRGAYAIPIANDDEDDDGDAGAGGKPNPGTDGDGSTPSR